MIYVSYGMPKSASTFTYVVTETVLKAAGYAPLALSEAAKGGKSRLNYIDPISWSAVERVASEIGEKSTVIKTHGAPDKRLLEAIEGGEIFASAVIRDPREIALSLLDHAKRSRRLGVGDFAEFQTVTDTFRMLDDQVNRLKRWLEGRKVLLLTYDEVSFDTELAVQRIIGQLGISVAVTEVIATLPERRKVEQFNKGIRRRYDSEMPADTQQIFLERYADVYRRHLGCSEPCRKVPKYGQAAAALTESGTPASVTDTAITEEVSPTAIPVVCEDVLVHQLVQSLYRVLLLREPDAKGFDAHVKQIRGGQPIEDVMRRFLKSEEFLEKHAHFLQTYTSLSHPKSGDVKLEFEHLRHNCEERAPSRAAADVPEKIIFVHSHRRSGTHCLLDILRGWFDVPDQVLAIPGSGLAPQYEKYSLSKDHEPFRGFKLTQAHIWGSQERWRRGQHLYETGAHLYVLRNPFEVLRSAYIFDLRGAEPKFRIDQETTFLEYITGRSLHERNNGLTRTEYWVQHVKSWCFDERALMINYEDIQTDLANTLITISGHIGLPVRHSPRPVNPTGVATGLTRAFLSKGPPIAFEADVIDVLRSAIEKILGTPPWRGLERYVTRWLSAPLPA